MSQDQIAEASEPEVPDIGPTPEKVDFYGIPVTIEWKSGQMRTFERPDWPGMMMSADYGYIDNTCSNEEGDELDCFLPAEGPCCDSVFIVSMTNDEGDTEEEKVFLGFEDQEAAEHAFASHYGPAKMQFTYRMTLGDFKKMLESRIPEAEHKMEVNTTGVEDGFGLTNKEPVLTIDLESKPETLKSLKNTPLHYMAKWLTPDQVRVVMDLRKSTNLKGAGLRVEPPRLGSDGLMDPKDLISCILAKGTNGPGHIPGQVFSPRKASYEEYSILVLHAQGVYPDRISKALGVAESDVVGKLRGWMVIPRG